MSIVISSCRGVFGVGFAALIGRRPRHEKFNEIRHKRDFLRAVAVMVASPSPQHPSGKALFLKCFLMKSAANLGES
jgi:hypothetical protein